MNAVTSGGSMSSWRRLSGTSVATGAGILLWVSQGRTEQDTIDHCKHDAPITVEMVKEYANEPLLHDCQAFIVKGKDGLEYGAVFRIIPTSHRLTSAAIDTALGTVPIIPASVLKGLFEPAPVVRTATNKPKVIAVALIVAQGDYSQLHLTRGKNCLYVFRYQEASDDPVQWSGLVVHIADTDANCPESPGTGKLLEARSKQVDGFADEADYPAVARWDWDGTNSEQYIGIKCGAAWCEIGKPGFDSSDPIPVPSGATAGERKVRLIKGWHDRQFLAMKRGTVLFPSQVMGVLIPDPNLGEYSRVSHKGDERPTVATVLLMSSLPEDRAVLDAYEKKYHIDTPGAKGPMVMRIRLKKGDDQVAKHDDEWEATIRNPNNVFNKEENRKLTYHGGTSLKLGIVRWRWLPTDEGTWVRCSEGCCEMTG
jgi:hypothetical protein